MRWLRTAGTVLLVAVTVLAAGLALARGETSTGVALAAFAGVLVVGHRLTRGPRVPDRPFVTGTVRSRGRVFRGLVLRSSRHLGLAVVGGTLFVIGSAALAEAGAVAVGLVGVAVFGAMTAVGAVSLRRGGGRLVLTPEELAHVAWFGHSVVPWDDVTGVRAYAIRSTVVLRVVGARAEIAGGALVVLAHLTRRFHVEVAPSSVGVDDDWLESLIERCIREPSFRHAVARGEVRPPS